MTIQVVHSVYRWGVITEDWLRNEVGPADGVEVRVVAARRDDVWRDGRPYPVDAIDDDVAGSVAAIADRLVARVTGRRWPWPYRRLVPGGRADIVHAHFGDWAWSIAPTARSLGAALVTSFYGYDASALPRRPRWAGRLRQVFQDSVIVVVEGPAMADRVAALGCPRHRLRVVPLGVDVPPAISRADRPADAYAILIAASLREKKGIDDGLRAVAAAAPRLPSAWRLEIVGDGPLRASSETLARDLGIADRVHWHGYVDSAALAAQLADADVLLQPSRTASDGDTEGGAPIVLLHAAAAGLPVVATRHADIPFLVDDGMTGRLADERDIGALAEALVALADPPLRRRYGEAARGRVIERASAERTRARLVDLYREIAGRQAGRES